MTDDEKTTIIRHSLYWDTVNPCFIYALQASLAPQLGEVSTEEFLRLVLLAMREQKVIFERIIEEQLERFLSLGEDLRLAHENNANLAAKLAECRRWMGGVGPNHSQIGGLGPNCSYYSHFCDTCSAGCAKQRANALSDEPKEKKS
jgi:hypothetical protein